ncbi:MAG: ATP-binding cassette domain-containing protein [Pseudomonadales bacterium]|nr:ATP-binding cassette domain-containing protein [Pseudomonadales bacterium]
MSGSVTSLSWPADRIFDGVRLLASRFTAGFTGSVPVGQQAGPLHSPGHSTCLTTEVSRACSSLGITPLPLSSELDHLTDCLCSATPLVVPVQNGQRALLVLSAGRRKALVLAPGGRTRHLDLQRILDALQPPVAAETARSLEGLKDRLNAKTVDKLLDLHHRQRSISVGCKIPVAADTGPFTSRLIHALAGRTAALLALHLLYFTLWITSWIALVNTLAGTGDTQSLTLLWALALLSSMLALPVESWLVQDIATRAGVMVKKRLLSQALRMDKAAVRETGIGALIARTLEANQLDSLASRGGVRVLLSVFDMIVILGLVTAYAGVHPLLLLFVAVLVLVVWQSRGCYRSELRLHSAHQAVTALHTEEMIGHRTRKIFVGRNAWHTQEAAHLAEYERASADADARLRRLSTAPRVWSAAATAAVLAQIYLQNTGGFDTVVLVGFVIIGAATLANVTIGIGPLLKAFVAVHELGLRNVDDRPHPDAADTGVELQPDSRAAALLKVQGLRFRYPSAAEAIIRDVDLTLSGNTKMLLSGQSGSGKSTIGALLAGRLQASAGTILSQGVDRHVTGRTGWLKHVSYIPQANDNHVLTDTFAFNLLLGRPWPPSAADLQQAEALAVVLGLGPLIEKMPAGMMQMVGDGGWRLSQGERSRLFVARGILQNPHVLISDELLSPLDPASSLEVLTAIEQLPNALILIAHS